jgi:hypothetical protein
VVLGGLLWVDDPSIIAGAVPTSYGVAPGAATGWGIHIVQGALMGVVFGALVTQRSVLGVVTMDVETPAIARLGVSTRIFLTGIVYGLAIWTLLPVIIVPVWLEVFVGTAAGEFPAVAALSLLGHLAYGAVLGFVVGLSLALGAGSPADPREQ